MDVDKVVNEDEKKCAHKKLEDGLVLETRVLSKSFSCLGLDTAMGPTHLDPVDTAALPELEVYPTLTFTRDPRPRLECM